MSNEEPIKSLEFSFANTEGNPFIYITNDAAKNKIVAKFTNISNNSISLKGEPVPSQIPVSTGDPSVITFKLFDSSLNTALVIGNDKWNHVLTGSSHRLTPKQDMTLASGDEISFSFGGLKPDGIKKETHFRYTWKNFGSVENESYMIRIAIQPLPPPTGSKLKKLDIKYRFEKGEIFVNDDSNININNYLHFFLNNKYNEPLVPESIHWGKPLLSGSKPPQPVFTISFVYGEIPGFGALLDAGDQKVVFSIVPEDQPKVKSGSLWGVTKEIGSESVTFSLKPQYDANQEILGASNGPNASALFKIGPISTDLEPGITDMYVTYQNIPGYLAGSFSIPIVKKKPTPGILSFFASPSALRHKGTVLISWQTFDVDHVDLKIRPKYGKWTAKKSQNGEIPVSTEKDYPLTCDVPTELTLIAYDENNNVVNSRQYFIDVKPPDPVITFQATPRIQILSNKKETPLPVEFSWNVDNNDIGGELNVSFVTSKNLVTSKNIDNPFGDNLYNYKGSKKKIDILAGDPATATVTLTATNDYGSYSKTLHLFFPVIMFLSWQEEVVDYGANSKRPDAGKIFGAGAYAYWKSSNKDELGLTIRFGPYETLAKSKSAISKNVNLSIENPDSGTGKLTYRNVDLTLKFTWVKPAKAQINAQIRVDIKIIKGNEANAHINALLNLVVMDANPS